MACKTSTLVRLQKKEEKFDFQVLIYSVHPLCQLLGNQIQL